MYCNVDEYLCICTMICLLLHYIPSKQFLRFVKVETKGNKATERVYLMGKTRDI